MNNEPTYPLYESIIETNKNNGWINPKFIPNPNKEYNEDYFIIKMDDFLEIKDNYEVSVFNINKRWGYVDVYCKRIK